jgi:hypothetical protein
MLRHCDVFALTFVTVVTAIAVADLGNGISRDQDSNADGCWRPGQIFVAIFVS